MPPAEQGESAADRTFDAEKEVADTPRIGRCSLERSCHRLRTRRCEARRHEKRSFERPPLWRRPRAAILSEWLLRATKWILCRHDVAELSLALVDFSLHQAALQDRSGGLRVSGG